MNDWLGVFTSLTYLSVVLVMAHRVRRLNYHFDRYFTHIMVANAWLLSRVLIRDLWLALVPPVAYLLFNLLNRSFRWVDGLNRMYQQNNYGALYFALSYVMLTYVAYRFNPLATGAGMGLMVMAYGDGLAALVGQHAGRYRYTLFHGYKTIEGSITMALVSMVVVALLSWVDQGVLMWPMILLMGVLASFVEALSPYGLDNLFVPFLIYLLYVLLTL